MKEILDLNINEENNDNFLIEETIPTKDEQENELNENKRSYIIPPVNFGFINDIYENSNIFSKLFFYWGYKVLKLTSQFKIEAFHLGKLVEKNDSKHYYNDIKYYWEEKKYKKIKNNGLIKTFLRTNIKNMILIFVLSVYVSFSEYFQVLLIKGYIDYYDNGTIFMGISNIKYVGLLFLLLELIKIFVSLQNKLIQTKIGLKIRYQLNCLVFHKILKIAPSSFSQRTSKGKIVNFIQKDSSKISDLIKKCPDIIIAPSKIIAYIYLLFNFYGISFLFGLIAFGIMLVINLTVYRKYNILEQLF